MSNAQRIITRLINKRSIQIATCTLLVNVGVKSYAQQHPNVVFIYIDDMGIGDLSCFGGNFQTPNIDRLAEQGRCMWNYYSAAPVSSASRAALTTGLFPTKNKILNFLGSKKHNKKVGQANYLDPKLPTIAKLFQQSGYTTAHIGKWHMGGGRDVKNAPSIAKYGFDVWCSTYESPDPDPAITATNWIWSKEDSIKRWSRTAYFVDKSLEFVKKQNGKPFFLNFWPDDVHTPWVPESLAEESCSPHKFNKEFEKESSFRPVLFELDRQIGRLMNGLDSMNLFQNTIVIFTSDNGPKPSFNQERTLGLRGEKNSLYEGGIHMPCIIRYPGVVPANSANKTTVMQAVDWMPTLCALANIALTNENSIDGENLVDALITGKSIKRQKTLYWEFGRTKYYNHPKSEYHTSPCLAIRKGDWKLLTDQNGTRTELYALDKDSLEKNDVSKLYPNIVESMKKELIDWFLENSNYGAKVISN